MGGRDGGTEQTQLLHFVDQRLRVLIAMLQFRRHRHDVVFHKPAHRLDYLLVQNFIHRFNSARVPANDRVRASV